MTLIILFPANFIAFHKDRCIGGGGVFVAIKDCLISLQDPGINASAEMIWVKLSLHQCISVDFIDNQTQTLSLLFNLYKNSCAPCLTEILLYSA